MSLNVIVDIQDGDMDVLYSLIADGHPVIVAVSTIDLRDWEEATTHSVVATGIDESIVSYHDPWFEQGPTKIGRREFESAWLYREYLYALIHKPT